LVNQPQTDAELAALRTSLSRGQPFGDDAWRQRTARRLGLEFTLHPRGRPRKQ
jgi:putative transposase